MSSAWTAAGTAFRFSAGGLEGTLERTDDAKSLRIVMGDWRIGGLGDLQWKVEGTGDAGTTTPIPDVAYIQLPYVVAPFVVNSPVGLRLTAFFRATDAGIDADFRLATIETLDNVSLDVQAEWSQGSFRSAGIDLNTRFPGVSAGVLTRNEGSAALLVDVGEHGEFSPNNEGAELKLFHQSLEKGVILVGRFALRPFTSDAQLQRDVDEWLQHPSASL
jgi:hypothetical protein